MGMISLKYVRVVGNGSYTDRKIRLLSTNGLVNMMYKVSFITSPSLTNERIPTGDVTLLTTNM